VVNSAFIMIFVVFDRRC